MQIQCLLWDFGDTLCDELSLWRTSPEWMAVYQSFDDDAGIGAEWNLGNLDFAEFVRTLSIHMSLSEAEIRDHLSRTDLFEFFPFTYAFFLAQHLPQAMVTVNPVKFREMAVELGFDNVCETIVISGEEKTADKGILCQTALRRMNSSYANEHALLIDNKQHNLDTWAAQGGPGYLYTTDQDYERDVARGIDKLVQ